MHAKGENSPSSPSVDSLRYMGGEIALVGTQGNEWFAPLPKGKICSPFPASGHVETEKRIITGMRTRLTTQSPASGADTMLAAWNAGGTAIVELVFFKPRGKGGATSSTQGWPSETRTSRDIWGDILRHVCYSFTLFILVTDIDLGSPSPCKLLERHLVDLPPYLLFHRLDLFFRIDLLRLGKINHQPSS